MNFSQGVCLFFAIVTTFGFGLSVGRGKTPMGPLQGGFYLVAIPLGIAGAFL